MATTDRNVSQQESEGWKSRSTIAGLFDDHESAQRALEELKQAGIPEQQIGLATSDSGQKQQASFWDRARAVLGDRDRTGDIDQFRASLEDSGIPDHEARYFSREIRAGQILVTVHTDQSHIQDAARILQQYGADLASTSGIETQADRTAVRTQANNVPQLQHIELLGEVLRVHKERVKRGEVAIRKEVVTEQQHVEVPVMREELVIERRSVNEGQPTTGHIGTDKEVRIPLTEEQVRVEKRPVVREQVDVGTRQVQDTRQVTDSTRREKLKVDKQGEVDVPSDVEKKNERKTA